MDTHEFNTRSVTYLSLVRCEVKTSIGGSGLSHDERKYGHIIVGWMMLLMNAGLVHRNIDHVV